MLCIDHPVIEILFTLAKRIKVKKPEARQKVFAVSNRDKVFASEARQKVFAVKQRNRYFDKIK